MIVAISATGREHSSPIDPRFGRCPYFQIIETDSLKVLEVIPNTAAHAGGGAGIQAAQLIVNKGVKVAISGHFGPNAYQTLAAAGVQCVAGTSGTVSETITRYKAGQLNTIPSTTVPPYAGRGGGRGVVVDVLNTIFDVLYKRAYLIPSLLA